MFFSCSKDEIKNKKPFCVSIHKTVLYTIYICNYFIIAEQAIRAPEFPVGCDTKSSLSL